MKLARLQQKFRDFILTGDNEALARHVRHRKRHADERLMIHHNNSMITLEEALADNFPILCRLVGDAFFSQLARAYVRKCPPKTPVLAEYGQDLAEFIEGIDQLDEYGYLPDIARLELAWNRAQHSQDASPLTQEQLAGIDMSSPQSLNFHFLPSLALINSAYPLLRIWQANREAEPLSEEISLDEGPDYIIVARPEWQAVALSVPAEVFEFVRLLRDRKSLGQAARTCSRKYSNFQLPESLALIFRAQLVTDITNRRDSS